MLKSRSIRLAVSLCVTVALLLPLAGLSAGSRTRCDEQVASTATCPGCGCCAVPKSGEMCCCCGHEQSPPPEQAVSQHASCCPDQPAASAEREPRSASPGICMCGSSDCEPAVPVPDGRTTTQQLVAKLLTSSPLIACSPRESNRRTFWEDSVPPVLLSQDAQCGFCVWRI